MRLKLGRPDLSQYSELFNVPRANDASGLTVTFLGVSTLLVSDGQQAFMTDGFFSRPGLVPVGIGKIRPLGTRIDSALARVGITELDAVVPVHSHYDHVLDSPEVALRTGAVVIGGTSSANVARGAGLTEEHIRTVTNGEAIEIAGGTLTFIDGEHCPPDRYPGTIDTQVIPPVRTTAYKCGEAWSLIFRHANGQSVLIQGSAGYRPGALEGQQADVAYLGIGQLGIQPANYIREYWDETVVRVGAKHVALTHWDDFFRPLDKPLRALPYAGDDLEVTMRAFTQFAEESGVSLHFPTVWEREDPWLLGG